MMEMIIEKLYVAARIYCGCGKKERQDVSAEELGLVSLRREGVSQERSCDVDSIRDCQDRTYLQVVILAVEDLLHANHIL